MTKRIEFDAPKKVSRPVEVKFGTRRGGKAGLLADRKANVPVHVKFTVKNPGR